MIRFITAVVLICLVGCNKHIECQNPPPSLNLRIAQVVGTDTIAAKNVAISYSPKAGSKTYISDLRDIDGVISTYELINTAYIQKDLNFDLEVDKKQVGSIQLKTYKSDAACDGWIHPSEIKLNGIPLVATTRGVYFVAL